MKFLENKASETLFQVGWLQKLSYNWFCEEAVIHCEIKGRGREMPKYGINYKNTQVEKASASCKIEALQYVEYLSFLLAVWIEAGTFCDINGVRLI